MVAHGLGGLGHVFHQKFFGRPLIPRGVHVFDGMDLHFSDAAVGAADGDIFHGAAETAHGVALKVR